MMKYVSMTLVLVLGSVYTSTSAHAQLLDARSSTAVNASLIDTTIETSAAVSTEAATDPDTTLYSDTVIDFSLTKGDIFNDTEYMVTDASSVRSAASLESYAASSVREDDRLESVAMTNDQITMQYRKDARLLWVFPTSMQVAVMVAQDGDVAVRYPWYSFLLTGAESRTALEARLEAEVARVDESLATEAEAELTGTDSTEVRRWTRVLSHLHASLSADASGSIEG
jgi:hypothetical protein